MYLSLPLFLNSFRINPFCLIFFRLISLKGSDFDTKRSLLEALRRGFPGGSVSFWPGIKNEHVNGYWHWLVGQYDPAEGVKLYGANHLGQHEDNYWVLSEEVHNIMLLPTFIVKSMPGIWWLKLGDLLSVIHVYLPPYH